MSVMQSLVSALVILMPMADNVVGVSEASLAFRTVGSVSAVDVRMSATVKLAPASTVATTRVAPTAIGLLYCLLLTSFFTVVHDCLVVSMLGF